MSVNVQQNGQLHQIAGSGGTSPAVEAKLAELEALIEQTRNLKADLENYGMVKLSNSSAVTENVGLALPASEKNASIVGTLAHDIALLNYLKGRVFFIRTFSTHGWHRVAYSNFIVEGMLLSINKLFNSSSNVQDTLLYIANANICSKIAGNVTTITKLRIVRKNSTYYYDIFSNENYNNDVDIGFCVFYNRGTLNGLIGLNEVPETSDGESVIKEFSIS